MALFKRLAPEAAEQVYMIGRNIEGGSIPMGAMVQLSGGNSDVSGYDFVQPNTNQLWAFRGVAPQAFDDQEVGMVLVHGYFASGIVRRETVTVPSAAPIVPIAGQNFMASVASTTASSVDVTQQPIVGFLIGTQASSSATATFQAGVFIRGL